MMYIGEGEGSGGTSNVAWNILGAIGITQTPFKPSPRFKFLTAGVAYFLLHQIVVSSPNKEDKNKTAEDVNEDTPILRMTSNTNDNKRYLNKKMKYNSYIINRKNKLR